MSKVITINDASVIFDDDTVKKYLILHGLLESILSMPDKSTHPDQNQASVRFFHEDETGEYHCMATYHWGQKDESENGFTMAMIKGGTALDAAIRFNNILSAFQNRANVWVPSNSERN